VPLVINSFLLQKKTQWPDLHTGPAT